MLSRELKELQHRGLISRVKYDAMPLKVEYDLTEWGRSLVPVLESIVEWGLTGVHEEILGGDQTFRPVAFAGPPEASSGIKY